MILTPIRTKIEAVACATAPFVFREAEIEQKSHRLCISASTMASCWSGRRGSNSLPPPWQGGALPDELRPHTRRITAPLRDASDRNRTNDTGIFSPLLYRLSYRGIESAFIPALPRIHLLNRGPRKNLRTQGFVGKRRNFSACHCNLACKIARQAADIPTKRPGSGSNRRPPA